MASGHGRSGADVRVFYSRMAREINDACDRGVIDAGPRRTGFLPPLSKRYFFPFVDTWGSAITYIEYFREILIDTPGSVGTADRLRCFADLSRGRLAPPEGELPIPPKQRWLDRIRLSILDRIFRLYPWTSPLISGASAVALFAASVIAVVRRRLSFLLILSISGLSAILANTAIVSLVEITSFHAVNAAYLTGAYGLWILVIFSSWLALLEGVRIPIPAIDSQAALR
jgi:hypothetical protein